MNRKIIFLFFVVGLLNLFAQTDSVETNSDNFVSSDSSKINECNYRFKDPNETRLFFAPTGRSLKSGKGYIALFEVFLPVLGYGITDYIDLAGGITYQLAYANLKITPFQNEYFATSFGNLFMTFTSNDKQNVNIVYSVNSVYYKNISLSVGAGFETVIKTPVLMLGCEWQTSDHTKLISESWFIRNSDWNMSTIGIRVFGKHLAADLAIAIFRENTDFPFVPWISFALNF